MGVYRLKMLVMMTHGVHAHLIRNYKHFYATNAICVVQKTTSFWGEDFRLRPPDLTGTLPLDPTR